MQYTASQTHNSAPWSTPPANEDHINEMDRRRSLNRALTAPASSPPNFRPHIFMPAYMPSTIHKSDLFFTNTPTATFPHHVERPRTPSTPLIPQRPPSTQYNSFDRPPLRPAPPVPPLPPQHQHGRSLHAPPLPPKTPVLHPTLPPPPPKPEIVYNPPQTHSKPELPPIKEFAVASPLSQAQSQQQAQQQDALSSQEEEELARALEESLKMAGNPPSWQYRLQNNAIAGSSKNPLPPQPTATLSTSDTVTDPHQYHWHNAGTSNAQLEADEAFARKLAAEMEEEDNAQLTDLAPATTSPIDATEGNSHEDSLASPQNARSSEDEDLALRIAAEEVQERVRQNTYVPQTSTSPVQGTSDLPGYSPSHTAQSNSSRASTTPITPLQSPSGNYLGHGPTGPGMSQNNPTHTYGTSMANNVGGSTLPVYAVSVSPPMDPSLALAPPTDLKRNNSSPSVASGSDIDSLIDGGNASSETHSLYKPQTLDGLRPEQGLLQPLRNSSRFSVHSSADDLAPSPMISPNASVVNVNQLVDPELLFGVSIGFMAPSMTNNLTPMQGVMPNIISLPYGRCPPLHLQAPSWRHLLKLMARLSATRLEPTVEAMAVSKTELKLRTVIQFVKPHHGSLDWRAVLWFTVDHPVPLALPGATKFTNGDVNVLPWSYTLSALPTLLRDGGVDTAVSKIYSIPATDSVPYPALPITFPNLAMYLQAALEDSRRFANDSSSGMRKLARMVETCYPMDVSSEPQERGSVGGLFKRVIGRGNKNAKKSRGGGNADTYELVTPFVLDEWG